MKIALAQINSTVGDVASNAARIAEFAQRGADTGAALVVFPEQTLLGYPAKDLLLRAEIVERNVAALERLAATTRGGAALLVGFAEPNRTSVGRPVHNAVALLAEGRVVRTWRKRLLPTYDVFDEARYFQPAEAQSPQDFDGAALGVTICEDMLFEKMLGRDVYVVDPAQDLVSAGATLLLNVSASPYYLNKHSRWRAGRLAAVARRVRTPILYVNQVGGNDELLFDGNSCVFDATGEVVGQARAFEEDCLLVDLDDLWATRREATPADMAELHAALVMGVRDYARKCGFRTAVLGLSGGIDSAVVAALATAALGRENVRGVALPSRFSSGHSLNDARALAANLNIEFSVIPIEPIHAASEATLAPAFAGRVPDVAEENLQARARGMILMALSNKFGSLLLTTGNKSELAVGYCTLYGDMCGGLAAISDVPKTMVYALAAHINATAGRELIPRSTLIKPPSAELRPNQTDQDSLPPYEVLDAIIERHEEQLQNREQIIAAGFDAATVDRVLWLMRISEYKRQQAAPGLKVTSRAFGSGRRMPIAAKY